MYPVWNVLLFLCLLPLADSTPLNEKYHGKGNKWSHTREQYALNEVLIPKEKLHTNYAHVKNAHRIDSQDEIFPQEKPQAATREKDRINRKENRQPHRNQYEFKKRHMEREKRLYANFMGAKNQQTQYNADGIGIGQFNDYSGAFSRREKGNSMQLTPNNTSNFTMNQSTSESPITENATGVTTEEPQGFAGFWNKVTHFFGRSVPDEHEGTRLNHHLEEVKMNPRSLENEDVVKRTLPLNSRHVKTTVIRVSNREYPSRIKRKMVDDKEDDSIFTIKGSKIIVPCVPMARRKDGDLDLATDFSWSDPEGNELTDMRFVITEDGTLEIKDARVKDSGIYQCKINSLIPSNEESDSAKSFSHKLVIYEPVGVKFTTVVTFAMKDKREDDLQTEIQDLLQNTICSEGNLCKPGTVKMGRCFWRGNSHQCRLAITYEAPDETATENCDEECVVHSMNVKLSEAKKLIIDKLPSYLKVPFSKNESQMMPVKTYQLISCKPGYHLVVKKTRRCFPCRPGSYSDHNSTSCKLCEIGKYEADYGKHVCSDCPIGTITQGMGAKSSDDCVKEETNTFQSIKSFFGLA